MTESNNTITVSLDDLTHQEKELQKRINDANEELARIQWAKAFFWKDRAATVQDKTQSESTKKPRLNIDTYRRQKFVLDLLRDARDRVQTNYIMDKQNEAGLTINKASHDKFMSLWSKDKSVPLVRDGAGYYRYQE
jgi:hypothetical protein